MDGWDKVQMSNNCKAFLGFVEKNAAGDSVLRRNFLEWEGGGYRGCKYQAIASN